MSDASVAPSLHAWPALCLLAALAGCNTVVPTPPAAAAAVAEKTAAAPAADTDTVTIEHTSLRSRITVYDSALRACRDRGRTQAIFVTQANQDPQRAPATGPQLSTFTCR